MKYWNFKVFVTNNGEREFQNWLDDLPPKDYFKIDKFIKHLEINKDMSGPYFDKIKGYENLYEIKVYGVNKLPYRPLGCFGPNDREFTILLGAIKKNGHYTPKDAFKIADKRRKLIHEKGRTDDY